MHIIAFRNEAITDNPISGYVRIDNFSIIDAPILTRLLQIASFTGLIEIIGLEGIPFQRFEGRFDLLNNVFTFTDSTASGLSLGFSLKGSVNIENEEIDLKGVLVPAYAINALVKNVPLVGPIITGRKGEGLIGVDYSMVGDSEDPDININPLSIFTPGILRSFFENFGADDK